MLRDEVAEPTGLTALIVRGQTGTRPGRHLRRYGPTGKLPSHRPVVILYAQPPRSNPATTSTTRVGDIRYQLTRQQVPVITLLAAKTSTPAAAL